MAVMAKRKPKPGKVRPLTAAQIRAFRESRGLTLQQAADLVGITWRAWANYEAGRAPSKPVAILIRLLSEKK